ncbi:MAG TPA: bifunctional glutamate N-acetyltransferase/amino-acid acetyltransferase ArgJ [Polyangiaceae bacterium]
MATRISGFQFAAVSAGIRKDGRIDVALAAAERPVVAAGLVTRNLVKAAPILVASERLAAGLARGVLVNSGCANACTGEPGLAAARRATEAVAQALGARAAELVPASTGVIGALLPAERIAAKAEALVAALSPDGADDFARAICTTDRWPKIAEASIETARGRASLLGIAKGAGMIHPDLGPPQATMLAFLFTDAVVERAELERALGSAADVSFNACSVDGDTSTNDMVLALASGASGASVTAAELQPALTSVCTTLARSMARDGEGAEHVIDIAVSGLATDAEARRVAHTVATSLLVKTALFGRDANWGRLFAAAGRSGVAFNPAVASVAIAGVEVVRGGVAVGSSAEEEAQRRMAAEAFTVELRLGAGPGRFTYVTSDLGHGYIDVNAGYRS